MSECEPESPLTVFKETVIEPLSGEAEAARRRRVVSRIDALRTELSADQPPRVSPMDATRAAEHPGRGAAPERPERIELKRVSAPWKWAAAALSLAAALLLYLQMNDVRPPLLRVTGGELTVESAAGPVRLGNDAQWEAAGNAVVTTHDAEASIVLPSQTTVAFAPESNAAIVREDVPPGTNTRAGVAGESIRLAGGGVTLNVPKLGKRHSLSVVTEHATVVVHGTVFTVLVEDGAVQGRRTRVAVQEGEVSVWSAGRERRLTAGQAWSSDEGSPAPESAARMEPVREEIERRDAGAADTSKRGPSVRPVVSELARQNQLFERAQAARRAGQHQLALQRFSELMRAHPRSEQAHNARVEHFRLLRSLGRHAEARRSAEVYLRVYPRGFAAAEARKLVQ